MSTIFIVRCRILRIIFAGIFAIFAIRLFDLQVLNYEEYESEARAQHEKRSVLPARRGDVLVRKNRLTKDTTPLATNNTLKMLFIDPLILAYPTWNPNLENSEQERGNPALVAELLAPILIHAHCEKIDGCEIVTDPNMWTPTERTAISTYQVELAKIFSQTERTRVVLADEVSDSRIEEINKLMIQGVSAVDGVVIAD
ncbi:MAG: hypothetical protein OEL89_01780, partial [Candidatus Peregrinibacteria bacterium]|nr:hypothetical protein [Candidatus Peregrinibacteria bacterium]